MTEQTLQINTGRRPLMSKAQNALLKQLFDCIRANEPLTLEHLVFIYANNVKSEIEFHIYWDRHIEGVNMLKKHNIIDCYNANNLCWQKKIKDLIKSWFVSAIGLLVIKGYLKVVPTIDID